MVAEAQRARRLRWRMRGAWQWPLFGLLTVVDALLIHVNPLAGDDTGITGALLLAGGLNLAAVALLGQPLGWLLRRRRRDMPKVVADDYAGTGLLLALAATFLVIGLAHRPEIADDRAAFARQSEAVRRYVTNVGNDFARAHVDEADTLRLEPNLFRTCVPTARSGRFDCMIVDTAKEPPIVRADPSHEANTSLNRRDGFR